jgi:MFS family permease
VFHRGYVLASGLYFVVAAHLSAARLVLLGAFMALTLLLSDIPAGVWSDAFSRKWPLVIGHGFLAAGMMLTGAVTTFGWLLVTQVLWGLGWARPPARPAGGSPQRAHPAGARGGVVKLP